MDRQREQELDYIAGSQREFEQNRSVLYAATRPSPHLRSEESTAG
jgi:hypothetical protein